MGNLPSGFCPTMSGGILTDMFPDASGDTGCTMYNIPNLRLRVYTTMHCTDSAQWGEIWNDAEVHDELIIG